MLQNVWFQKITACLSLVKEMCATFPRVIQTCHEIQIQSLLARIVNESKLKK